MRRDPEYLEELSDWIDELAKEGLGILKSPERCTFLADLRDYFLYLTLDALEDPELARELVSVFERLEEKSKTHKKVLLRPGTAPLPQARDHRAAGRADLEIRFREELGANQKEAGALKMSANPRFRISSKI